MAIQRKNVVNFSDIFYFAEKKFKVNWNTCDDVFFNTILTYKRVNNFEKLELKGELEDNKDECELEENDRKAREIMLAFMEENKVESLLVIND